MKVLCAVALITALTTTGLSQRAQNNTDEQLKARNAPDVFVYSASAFGPDKNGDSNFTIDVGNTGGNTITAIEWEYYLTNDLAGHNERENRTFRSAKLKLLPDARTKLTEQVHHYTDKFVTGFRLDTVRIMRVEYADGSSWQRPVDQR
jgi:hypothetical protein